MANPATAAYTTQAAEGLPRRAFTVADLERMVEIGLIDPDERIELIGGEIVPLSPKGNHHELLKIALTEYWIKAKPENLILAPETGLRLAKNTYVEPDFIFYRRGVRWADLQAADLALVVELGDASLAYDRGRKAQLYAGFGVGELWVIDAVRLRTHIYRTPGADGYRAVTEHGPEEKIAPLASPLLAVALSGLDLR